MKPKPDGLTTTWLNVTACVARASMSARRLLVVESNVRLPRSSDCRSSTWRACAAAGAAHSNTRRHAPPPRSRVSRRPETLIMEGEPYLAHELVSRASALPRAQRLVERFEMRRFE